MLQALSAVVGGGALAAMSQSAEAKDASELPPPKRALTGRDEAGKSVFKSFDVTPKVVEIDSNPGLTFYELYMTEGVPGLTGLEPDPMLKGTKDFPGRMARCSPDLVSAQAPRRLQAAAGRHLRERAERMSDKVPGMGDHFDRSAPGMHTRIPSTTGSWFAAR